MRTWSNILAKTIPWLVAIFTALTLAAIGFALDASPLPVSSPSPLAGLGNVISAIPGAQWIGVTILAGAIDLFMRWKKTSQPRDLIRTFAMGARMLAQGLEKLATLADAVLGQNVADPSKGGSPPAQ